MAGDQETRTVPTDFDWVKARASWNLDAAYDTLLAVVTRDVESMKHHTDEQINLVPARGGRAFLVSTRGDMSSAGPIRFRQDETQITIERVERGTPVEVTAVKPVILPDGTKKLEATGAIVGRLEPWQLSRHVLEPLFFPTA